MMAPKCDAGGNRAEVMSTDPVLMSTDTVFLRYHLLGALCWLYPVGNPRIYIYFMLIKLPTDTAI